LTQNVKKLQKKNGQKPSLQKSASQKNIRPASKTDIKTDPNQRTVFGSQAGSTQYSATSQGKLFDKKTLKLHSLADF
jgi:hypothetical protein